MAHRRRRRHRPQGLRRKITARVPVIVPAIYTESRRATSARQLASAVLSTVLLLFQGSFHDRQSKPVVAFAPHRLQCSSIEARV